MKTKLAGILCGCAICAGLAAMTPLTARAAGEIQTATGVAEVKGFESDVKGALREYKNVTIEAKDGDVVMRGYVATQEEKTALEQKIRAVPGVKYVRDEVTVGQGALDAVGEYVGDAAMTTAVKTKLLAAKGLDSLDIHVKTVDGAVTLSGEVENAAQVELAGKVAKEIKGVKEVVNNLSVKK